MRTQELKPVIRLYQPRYILNFLHLLSGGTSPNHRGVAEGSGLIWLNSVQCNGTEARLIDCQANAIGSSNCTHGLLAGVSCIGEFNEYTVTSSLSCY